jgi:hypothetical protein
MIQKPGSTIHHDPLETLIDRTLARDAENTRSRFAVVPNAQLTAKLALTTASRGLLGSLASKFALYAGAAIVVGCAIYFFPSIGPQPVATRISPPPQILQQPLQQPTPATSKTLTSTKTVASRSKIDSNVAPRPITASPNPSLQLNEGDGKNIPKITDPNYLPPLK